MVTEWHHRYLQGVDGGACAGPGNGDHACCVDHPYALGVSLSLAASGQLADLDVNVGAEQWMNVSAVATPPAAGSPGATAYWVASVEDGAGQVQSSLVFRDPEPNNDGGYALYEQRVRFVLPLAAGAALLHIQNWNSGQVLVDLDLRGQLQLLCIDHPCLSLCQARPQTDAAAPALDAGAVAAE
jgi:hypothetical protein